MKNYNFNLIKLLHLCSKISWSIEKHYKDDADNLSCDCPKIISDLRNDINKHIKTLSQEIKKHDLTE